jgi:hypothetical protein
LCDYILLGRKFFNALTKLPVCIVRDRPTSYSDVELSRLSGLTVTLDTAALGQNLPVVVRKTRQLDIQEPPVTRRNITLAEVPQSAAERRQAPWGQKGLIQTEAVREFPQYRRLRKPGFPE